MVRSIVIVIKSFISTTNTRQLKRKQQLLLNYYHCVSILFFIEKFYKLKFICRNDFQVNPPPNPAGMVASRPNTGVVQQNAVDVSSQLIAASMSHLPPLQPQQPTVQSQNVTQIPLANPQQPSNVLPVPLPQQTQAQPMGPQANVTQTQGPARPVTNFNDLQRYVLSQGRRLQFLRRGDPSQQGQHPFF